MNIGRSERGGAGFLISIILALAASSVLIWSNLDDLTLANAYAKRGMQTNQVATNIAARIKLFLAKEVVLPDNKCAKANEAFKKFRDFSKANATLIIDEVDVNKIADEGCIIIKSKDPKKDEIRIFSKFKFSIAESDVNTKNLHKTIKVQIDMKTKSYGPHKEVISRPVKLDKEFLLSMARLAKFNVVFAKSGAVPLVKINGKANVEFTGLNYYARSDMIRLKDIAGSLDNPTYYFKSPFYVRGKGLKIEMTNFSQSIVTQAYPKGIETSVGDEKVVDDFLPKDDENWSVPIDYGLIKDGRYPLPGISGATVIENCTDIPGEFAGLLDAKQKAKLEDIFKNDSTVKTFSAARADNKQLPTTEEKGIPSLAETCHYDMENVRTFVFMRQKDTLTLNFSGKDNVFCGVVVADRLEINISQAGNYALFGYFVVGQIRVNAPSGAKIYFHNPSEQKDQEVAFPFENQSQDYLAKQIYKLSSSIARNLFVPIARKSKTYVPYSPRSFLQSCGGSVYAFKAQYPAMYEEDAYTKDVLTNEIDALFFVENIL